MHQAIACSAWMLVLATSFISVRCFGNKAALTAEATWITREGVAPVPTMSLEVAPRDGADVDWSKKIV
jgi:hypothetical protein